jgi:dipeptidyl-peptidase 4
LNVTEAFVDPSHQPIPFEEIAKFPLPGTALPAQVAFSPTGRVLTYVFSPDSSLDRRLFAVDLDAAEATNSDPFEVRVGDRGVREDVLSRDEQLRRERAREIGLGVTTATWAREGDVLLVPLPDGLHVVRGLSGDPASSISRRVVDAGSGPVLGPQLSPDGSKVAFVRDGELVVADTDGAETPRVLTGTAVEGRNNGLAEFIAQEEMARDEGVWWSSDSKYLAYAEVDERAIPLFRIVHQGSDEVGPDAVESHRYPFAGGQNAVVRLGVIAVGGGTTVWMETGDADQYLARVHWTPGGELVAELLSRAQDVLRVVAFAPDTGAGRLLHVERSAEYVNLHNDFRALENGEWLWSSERSGFRHLEIRSASGELLRVLTEGEWQVDKVEAVDEEMGLVYFSATRDGPLERHLYTVGLNGGMIRKITNEPGTHAVVVGTRCGLFVDRHASLESPPNVRVRAIEDGVVLATLHGRRDPRIDALGLRPPEIVDLTADDGTLLYGLYYAPEPSDLPVPLVVSVYGGPHVQLVVDDWAPTVAMRAQALRRLGYAVLVVDNRGSARRGAVFERAIWRNLGVLEVADQVRGVRWAVAERNCDPKRVAIYGWSYGGYMALSCLTKAPELFGAAVAGAPVTDWDGYDTCYTERYMGTPLENADGYAAASVLNHVDEIAGDLLLVHGMIDENVHFRHTARLINRLVVAKKEHQLLCFPEERHLPRRLADRAFMEENVIGWLTDALAR